MGSLKHLGGDVYQVNKSKPTPTSARLRKETWMSRYEITAQRPIAIAFAVAVLSVADRAFASSAGMPWESPLQQLVQSLTGPVAKAIGIASIVIAALGMTISEGGHAMKTFLRILFALAIAFTAGTFGLRLVGFSGGLAV
jgi:type IV secretion system protein TrbC